MVIEISCLEVWREISNYLDHDVNPELRRRMEEHLQGCAHCKAVLDGSRNVLQIVGDDRIFEVPSGSRLYSKLRAELAKHRK